MARWFSALFILCAFSAYPFSASAASIAKAAVSPNGALIIAETVVGGVPMLTVLPFKEDGTAPRLFSLSGQSVTLLSWADSSHALIFTEQVGPGAMRARDRAATEAVLTGGPAGAKLDIDRMKFTSLYALNVQSMRAVQLLGAERDLALTSRLDDVVAIDGDKVLMRAPIWVSHGTVRQSYVVGSSFYGSLIRDTVEVPEFIAGVPALWRVSLQDGSGERIGNPELTTASWLAAHASAAYRLDRTSGGYRLTPAGGRGSVSISLPADRRLRPLGVRSDGLTAEVMVYHGEDPERVVLVSLGTGAVTEHEATAAGLRAPSIIRDERSGLVDGWRDAGRVVWIDPVRRTHQQTLVEAFPEALVEIISSSSDGQRHLFRVTRPTANEWYSFDAIAKQAELLGFEEGISH
jgi:hypothetical protein